MPKQTSPELEVRQALLDLHARIIRLTEDPIYGGERRFACEVNKWLLFTCEEALRELEFQQEVKAATADPALLATWSQEPS